jgi:hypothetical protein
MEEVVMRRVAIGGVTVLAAAGLALAGISAASADRVDADEVVAALDSRTTPADALPASLRDPDYELVASSSRYLGADGPRDFWVAEQKDGSLCILVSLGDAGQTIGGACNRPEAIASAGQLVGVQGSDGVEYVTYLLPDAADRSKPIGGGWTSVGDNVVVARADTRAPNTTVPLQGGGSITLRRS